LGGQEHISAESYRIYAESRDIATEFPGARGFGYIRRVPAKAIKAYIDEVRNAGDLRFEIRQLTAHVGEVDIVHRIGPLQPNRDLIGRVLQVLANFLSNAAKFSPPEYAVDVSATLLHGMVRVAVTDRGFRRNSSRGCSKNSLRPTGLTAERAAAQAWVWPSPNPWSNKWAAKLAT
jgi:hypothetical protein